MKCFACTLHRGNFKNNKVFVFEQNREGKSHSQSLFKTFFFSPTLKHKKLAFSNSSGLKGVFEKLRFHDGLVWMVGLTVEIKLRFQISPVQCGRGVSQYGPRDWHYSLYFDTFSNVCPG